MIARVLAAGILAIIASVAFAQLAAPTAQEFVSRAAIATMFEIRSAEIAVAKTESAAVKEFARQMMEDHASAGAALERAVAAAGEVFAVPRELDALHQAKIAELDSASKAAFDRLYAEMQIEALDDMILLFLSYEGGTVVPLRNFAHETLPPLARHLERAKQLADRT